jgi:NAD(P)H-dependent FMN reductase
VSNDKPKIQIIISSTRQNRFGETVGQWFHRVASARDDIEVELLDLRDYPMPFFDEAMSPAGGHYAEEAKPWAEKIAQGDGFVIIAAEYNHGPTAVLKNAMDHIYREWNNKPLGFVSYGGGAGGARAVQQLRLTSIELQMAPIREAVVIPMARGAFEDGKPKNDALNDRANAVLDQLTWWAQALKKARGES